MNDRDIKNYTIKNLETEDVLSLKKKKFNIRLFDGWMKPAIHIHYDNSLLTTNVIINIISWF